MLNSLPEMGSPISRQAVIFIGGRGQNIHFVSTLEGYGTSIKQGGVSRVLLEAFYEQHKDELTAALTQYSGDREAAADAVQESFLRALKSRAILSEMQEKSLWSWLYVTAKNALIDEKRKTSRNILYNDYDDVDPAGDVTDVIIVKELLHKLPPNLMHVVSLRYFVGLNASEIGKMKGIPPSTVRAQLRAAISILKKYVVQSDLNF